LTRWLRRAVAAFLGGALLVGVAWAGVGLAPSPGSSPSARRAVATASAAALASAATLADQPSANPLRPPSLKGLKPLPAGQFMVGTAVTSLAPTSPSWQTVGCSQFPPGQEPGETAALVRRALFDGHLPPGWPKSPNCIYLGGFGIAPARAATGVDTYAGYNVRSIAISNGRKTVVWQIIDAVGYFNTYRTDLCPDCGILDMRRHIAGSVGLPEDDVAIGATHTHGGFDGYGAWGGIPDWYRTEVRDDVIASAYAALRDMRPASLEIGDVNARQFSSQRRDTYYSANDFGAVWLQARRLAGAGQPAGQVIATLVNYAAHPTMTGEQPVMHGDWPATADKAMGERFGGTGLLFEGGLGNVSPSAPNQATHDLTGDKTVDRYDQVAQMGNDFADYIGKSIAKGGHVLADNTMIAKTVTIAHPGTNSYEVGGAIAGLLDRQFLPGTEGADGPGTYTSKTPGAIPARACTAAGPVQVKTQVSGFRIGDLTVVTAPGEIFGTASIVAKSQLRRKAGEGGETMVFGQTEDSLGYIIPSVEVDPAGGLTSNIDAGGAVGEYEEEFMLDRCFGDHVLETMLDVGHQLG
jgi:hypothetical protein